ncbi:MAG TPA: hypothetical protein VFA09_10925 [Ktedonobacteraceae bacterium]|jgi:hypothetical protein|nr:hypothetical protein [Ktedonobacteraceae bacterium]
MGATQAKKQLAPVDFDEEEDDSIYQTRPPSSARRYIQPVEHDTLEDTDIQKAPFIQKRRSSANATTSTGMISQAIGPKTTAPRTSVPPPRASWRYRSVIRRFPLVALIIGMLLMALLAYLLSSFGTWWQIHQDDVTYGRPRTFQVDAAVGHNDGSANPSHFIFLNLNRHVEIIEFPGGDATHAHIYIGPTLFGDGQDLTPITGEFRDVNGDGKPDMIVHIQDQVLVYINTGTEFRPAQPSDHVHL